MGAVSGGDDHVLPGAGHRGAAAFGRAQARAGDQPALRAAGDPAEAPVPRTWPQEWILGIPDAIVDLPQPVAVAATGRMSYQYREVITTFPEDRWITGLEVRPTALAQVHHVLIFASRPDQKRVTDGDDFLAAYVPGRSQAAAPCQPRAHAQQPR